MYILYIDESGTSAVPGNTSHFVLAGLSIPISRWREADREITSILLKYELQDQEIHTAWMLRRYLEQSQIMGFERLSYAARRSAVLRERTSELLRLQRQSAKSYKQAKKNYIHTEAYIHLTFAEREQALNEIASAVSKWQFATLFAECINKIHFDAARTTRSIDEQALEQLVSRFEKYLIRQKTRLKDAPFGVLVHDNNDTVARKHTELMRTFHAQGTLWTGIGQIIETPLFVDSKLTRMVQLADLCSYALRRFVENGETKFLAILDRADSIGSTAVGIRHYTEMTCQCSICALHRQPQTRSSARKALPRA